MDASYISVVVLRMHDEANGHVPRTDICFFRRFCCSDSTRISRGNNDNGKSQKAKIREGKKKGMHRICRRGASAFGSYYYGASCHPPQFHSSPLLSGASVRHCTTDATARVEAGAGEPQGERAPSAGIVVPPSPSSVLTQQTKGKNKSLRAGKADAVTQFQRHRFLISQRIGMRAASFVTPRLAWAVFADYRSFAQLDPAALCVITRSYLSLNEQLYRATRRVRGASFKRRQVRIFAPIQLDALFSSLMVAIENRSISTVGASSLFRAPWPEEAMRYKRAVRQLVLAQVSSAITATQDAKIRHQQQEGHPQQDRGTAVAVEGSIAESSISSGSAKFLLSPKDAAKIMSNLAGALRNDPSIMGCLANIAFDAPVKVQRLPAAATSTVTPEDSAVMAETVDAGYDHGPVTAADLVRMMWAVHESKTPAPPAFWHAAVTTLRQMQMVTSSTSTATTADADKSRKNETKAAGGRNNKKMEAQQRRSSAAAQLERELESAGGHDDDGAVETGEYVSPLAARVAATTTTQESASSAAAAAAAKKKKVSKLRAALTQAASTVTPVTVIRALRVLHRQGIKTDTAFQRLLAENALAAIGNIVADRFRSADGPFAAAATAAPSRWKSLTRLTVAKRIFECTGGMQPKQLLTLIDMAGELGVRYDSFGHRFARELLYPLVRHCTRPDERELLLSALASTHCHDPLMVQAVIDSVADAKFTGNPPNPAVLAPTQGELPKPDGRSITAALRTRQELRSLMQTCRRLCSVIVANNALAPQLQLSRFADVIFHLLTSEEHAQSAPMLLRPPEMLTFVEQLQLISRSFDPQSVFTSRLRDVVEAFAEVFTRHLEAGVLPLFLANRLLEFSVILGMRPSANKTKNNNKQKDARVTESSVTSAPPYRNVMRLLAARNAAHELLAARGNDDLLESFTGPVPVVRVYLEMVAVLQALTYAASTAGSATINMRKAIEKQGLDIPRLQRAMSKYGVVPSLAASVLVRDLYFPGQSPAAVGLQLHPIFQQAVSLTLLHNMRVSGLLTAAVDPRPLLPCSSANSKEAVHAAPSAVGQAPCAGDADGSKEPSLSSTEPIITTHAATASNDEKPVMRQRVLNVLGMYPATAQPSLLLRPASSSMESSAQQPAAKQQASSIDSVLQGLWALIRLSPVLPMKRNRDLWQFVHATAVATGASEKELSKTSRMVNLAAASATPTVAAAAAVPTVDSTPGTAAAPATIDA